MDPTVSAEEKFKLLKAACYRHASLSGQCVMGMGFDRHLYALSQLSKTSKQRVALFEDDAFVKLMTDTLCSSSLKGDFVEAMMASPAFGDFVNSAQGGDEEDGKRGKYFVCYSVFEDELRFYVNGFEPESMDSFRDALTESLDLVISIVKGDEEKDKGKDEGDSKPSPKAAPSAALPDMNLILSEAMKDPVIAKALTNRAFVPILLKIKADPSILFNPMERLKDDLAANPAAAVAAKEILPKIKAMLSKSQVSPKKEKKEEANGEVETAKPRKALNVGDSARSVYGQGRVVEVRDDGFLVLKMQNWLLAGGSEVTCYLSSSAASKVEEASLR